MPNASRVPVSGSDLGKNSLAKTRPVTVPYRKKSYHSIAVPTVLAMTARVSCFLCSSSESVVPAAAIVDMMFPPVTALQWTIADGEISHCFGTTSTFSEVTPVMLPPGRPRLVTRPSLTGSSPTTKTVGIVVVGSFGRKCRCDAARCGNDGHAASVSGSCRSLFREPRALPCLSIRAIQILSPRPKTCRRRRPLGRQIEVFPTPTNRDIDTAFATLVQKRVDALIVSPGPLFINRRAQLVTQATHTRP